MEQVFSQSWQTAPSTVWLWMFNAKIRVVALFSHCARTRRPNSESWTRIISLHTLRMMDLPPKVYVLIITVMDFQESVQFRMAFTHTGKPKINMLHPVSQRFPLHCLWNSSNVVWCLKYRDVCMYDCESIWTRIVWSSCHLITKVVTLTLLCYCVLHCDCVSPHHKSVHFNLAILFFIVVVFHLITKVFTLTLLCYFVFHSVCVSSHHKSVYFNLDLFVISFSIVVMQLPCLSQSIYHLSVNKVYIYMLSFSLLCGTNSANIQPECHK